MTISTSAPMHIGKVTLTVHDLAAVTTFYQQAIGLQLLRREGDTAELGAGGTTLLVLRRDMAARRHGRREAGLFHTAFLLPQRADLGRWVRHAAETHLVLQGASDHLVSEALYLSDPEGNGIEVYADRPASTWRHHDGMVEMSSDPLDIGGLMAAGGDQPWQEAPAGTVVGHVHLQVGALPEAEAFYSGLLGFDIMCRYTGGTFYGSGGYHHHLASNVWNSRGASLRAQPSTGLADVELLVTPQNLEAIHARAGTMIEAGTLTLQDPWGTSLTLRSP